MNVVVTPCLRKVCENLGWTQKALSEASGVPQSAISRFDKQANHTDAHLFALKTALGLASVDELFEVTIKDEEEESR